MYLLTLKVNRYCLLASHGNMTHKQPRLSDLILLGSLKFVRSFVRSNYIIKCSISYIQLPIHEPRTIQFLD